MDHHDLAVHSQDAPCLMEHETPRLSLPLRPDNCIERSGYVGHSTQENVRCASSHESTVVQPHPRDSKCTFSGIYGVYYDLEDLKILAKQCYRTTTTNLDGSLRPESITAGWRSFPQVVRRRPSTNGGYEGDCQPFGDARAQGESVCRDLRSMSRPESIASLLQRTVELVPYYAPSSTTSSDMAASIFTRHIRP